MLLHLSEDLIREIVPIMMKMPDVERQKAEELVRVVEEKFGTSKYMWEIPGWFANNKVVKEAVDGFKSNKENAYAALFGDNMEWLLTKAPLFYNED